MKKIIALLMLLAVFVYSASAETVTLTYSSRGVDVHATLVTPDGLSSYPIVILAHGHGGSREENVGFAAIADALAAKSIASFRMDFPGCGESTESFQMNTLSNMKADVTAAIAYVQAQLPVTKLGLFGYSMGGRIVLEMLAEGTPADAAALLAPAADTEDLKNLFGGADAYAAMQAEAEEKGFVTFTTIYGQVQELSKAWFSDLAAVPDSATAAAEAWHQPALVIWGQDDEAVTPSVSAMVADTLHAAVLNASGEGHGYGFYSEDDKVRMIVANGVADFMAEKLK